MSTLIEVNDPFMKGCPCIGCEHDPSIEDCGRECEPFKAYWAKLDHLD